jgi:hypothetical protein
VSGGGGRRASRWGSCPWGAGKAVLTPEPRSHCDVDHEPEDFDAASRRPVPSPWTVVRLLRSANFLPWCRDPYRDQQLHVRWRCPGCSDRPSWRQDTGRRESGAGRSAADRLCPLRSSVATVSSALRRAHRHRGPRHQRIVTNFNGSTTCSGCRENTAPTLCCRGCHHFRRSSHAGGADNDNKP